jgi:flavin-dependent dehydrogenase
VVALPDRVDVVVMGGGPASTALAALPATSRRKPVVLEVALLA